MGERPKGRTLDRINNDGDYEPNNCRWATPKEQGNNRRGNVYIKYNGLKLTVTQWAEKLKIPADRLYYQVRIGCTPERMLS